MFPDFENSGSARDEGIEYHAPPALSIGLIVPGLGAEADGESFPGRGRSPDRHCHLALESHV